MIHNDVELKATQERIALFEGWVVQFRVTIPPAEFKVMAGAYLAEIEKMYAEVMEYLRHHASEPTPAEAAKRVGSCEHRPPVFVVHGDMRKACIPALCCADNSPLTLCEVG